MVKAAAGGGGRGMRLVASEAELDAALASARGRGARRRSATRGCCSSAPSSGARHVEIQVFADAHGRVHPSRRARLLGAAAPPEAGRGSALARGRRRRCAGAWARPRSRWRAPSAIVGAGTVEFLLDARRRVLLHRDEHAGCRSSTRSPKRCSASTSSSGSCASPPARRCRWTQDEALGASKRRPRDRGAAVRRGSRRTATCRSRAASSAGARRPACAPTTRSPTAPRCRPFYDSMLGKLIAHAPTPAAIVARSPRRSIDRLLGRDDQSRVPRPRRARRRVRARRGRHDFPRAPRSRDDAARSIAAPTWLEAIAAAIARAAAARAAAAALARLVVVAGGRHAACRSRSTAPCGAGA